MTIPDAKALCKGALCGIVFCAWFAWLVSMFSDVHIERVTPQPTVLTTAVYHDRVCVVFLTNDGQVLTKCATTQ